VDVLIATWQAGGGAQAAIGLGRLLAERGHSTRILAPAGYAARVAAAGCVHRPFPPELEWDPTLGWRFEDQRAIMDRVFFGRDLGDALAAELAVEPADVLVIDYLLRSVIGVAEQVAVPTVLLIHTIYGFHGGADDDAARRRWYAPVNAARSQLGLPLLPVGPDSVTLALVRRAAGALVVIPREFDDWPEPPASVVHVGWITEEAAGAEWESPWPPDDRRPLVVVSLGTTYMRHEELLGRIVQALEGIAARVLVLTGLELAPEEVSSSPTVEVRSYVPHAAVLPEASLVVTHAGTGTLLAAFSTGVPVVCLPLVRDQLANGHRVEELGLGRVLPSDAAATTIRTSIAETLAFSELHDRAARMAAVIRGYDGGTRAVTMLERLLPQA
jgi:UDP:flavonoid glycosyltransferase YjiC (YdhE family)